MCRCPKVSFWVKGWDHCDACKALDCEAAIVQSKLIVDYGELDTCWRAVLIYLSSASGSVGHWSRWEWSMIHPDWTSTRLSNALGSLLIGGSWEWSMIHPDWFLDRWSSCCSENDPWSTVIGWVMWLCWVLVCGRPLCVPVLVFPGCQSTRCVCILVRGEHLDWLLVTNSDYFVISKT